MVSLLIAENSKWSRSGQKIRDNLLIFNAVENPWVSVKSVPSAFPPTENIEPTNLITKCLLS
jgi:hypothetical protein